MKYLILVLLFAGAVQAKEKSLRPYRFVEASSFSQESALPPKLQIVLDVFCNEELVQVIRHETVDPKTQKVTIAVGALVQENLKSSCAGKRQKLTVDAGTTFSGREFEVIRIKK